MAGLVKKRLTERDIRQPLGPLTFSFPNMGGDAVSGGTHSPVPIAKAVGIAGRR